MNYQIGIFDSGIGGVSVLKELIKEIPDSNIFYLSDSKNCPYGDKSKEVVTEIVFQNVEFLRSLGCPLIVIACNTATAIAINQLRKTYPDTIFIGTEPAVKMVYDSCADKESLLLATKLTLDCARVQGLMQKYPISHLKTYACSGLADLIEEKNQQGIQEYFQQHFTPYRQVDSVVLGCTHYPLIKKELQNFFSQATIFDGSIGVAKETKRKLELLNLPKQEGTITFFDTSKEEKKEEIFKFYLQS